MLLLRKYVSSFVKNYVPNESIFVRNLRYKKHSYSIEAVGCYFRYAVASVYWVHRSKQYLIFEQMRCLISAFLRMADLFLSFAIAFIDSNIELELSVAT